MSIMYKNDHFKNMEYEFWFMVDLEEWAKERPMFTLNEAERATEIGREYLRKKLSRMVRDERLYRIERGKYTFHDDPMIYATHIQKPSYLSFWSALSYYNLTTQQPTKIQVVSGKRHEDLEDFEFTFSKNMFGFRKDRYNGFEINVAEKEKLLIDVLMSDKVPLDELKELFEEVEIEKTVQYARKADRNSVKKRLGFLFENIIGEEILELQVKDGNYPLLDLTKPEKGYKSSKWGLVVNNSAF